MNTAVNPSIDEPDIADSLVQSIAPEHGGASHDLRATTCKATLTIGDEFDIDTRAAVRVFTCQLRRSHHDHVAMINTPRGKVFITWSHEAEVID